MKHSGPVFEKAWIVHDNAPGPRLEWAQVHSITKTSVVFTKRTSQDWGSRKTMPRGEWDKTPRAAVERWRAGLRVRVKALRGEAEELAAILRAHIKIEDFAQPTALVRARLRGQ